MTKKFTVTKEVAYFNYKDHKYLPGDIVELPDSFLTESCTFLKPVGKAPAPAAPVKPAAAPIIPKPAPVAAAPPAPAKKDAPQKEAPQKPVPKKKR